MTERVRAGRDGARASTRLGCVAVGYTIYLGSAQRFDVYSKLRAIALEAKRTGWW